MKFCSVNKYNLKSARCEDSWIRHGLKMCTHVTLLVLHFAGWCTQAYGVQDKLDVTCIDLYLCNIYVFVYLHVTCGHYIKLESRYDMWYVLHVFSLYFFFVYLYCPVEPSVAINTWAIGWSVGICLVTEHLSLKTSNGLSVAINIQGSKLSVAKSTVWR